MDARPSLDEIFGGAAKPVPLYQPANENDRNAAIANVFQPQRPSLDEIFGQPKQQPKDNSFSNLISGQSASGQQAGKYLDAFTSGAYAPFKPIVDNSLEALKNTATATGEAMSEPYNEQNVSNWMIPFDVGMKTLGKAGNAIGGAGQAMFSPVTGGLTASAEATMPMQEKIMGASGLSPEQEHEIAQTEGGFMSGGVAGAMGANAKTNMANPPANPPYDPLQPAWDKLGQMSGNTDPRASFMANNSSDPMQPPAPISYKQNEMYDKADLYYDGADQAKAVIGAAKISNIKSEILSDLQKNNYDADFHPDTAKWLDKLDEKSTDKNGNPIDLEWYKVNGLRKLLNGDITKNLRQGNNEDAYQAMIARSALDRGTSNIQPPDLISGDPAAIDLTRKANTLFSAASKQDEIQNILDKGDTAKVPSTVYQNGLSKLAQKLKINSAGYTPEEIAAVNYGAKTGIVVPILRTLGGKLTSGVVGGVSGAAGGGLIGGLGGIAAGEAVGFPFRAAANALVRKGGTNVQNLIGSRPDVQKAMKP